MMFMNEYEIDEAAARHRDHPILGPATRTLRNLMEATNQNSDGWAYWPKPCRAAKNLQVFIQGDPPRNYRFDTEREDATKEGLAKAYRPLKAFRTRQGLAFDIEEVS